MPFVRCLIPGEWPLIGDHEFKPHREGGWISAKDLPADEAEHFAGISGYEIVESKNRRGRPVKGPKPPADETGEDERQEPEDEGDDDGTEGSETEAEADGSEETDGDRNDEA